MLLQTMIWAVFAAPLLSIDFEEPFQRNLSWLSTIFRGVYPHCWMPLFGILCEIATQGLESIADQITCRISPWNDGIIICPAVSNRGAPILLRRWKNQIVLIGRYINCLSASFGLLLVFVVPYSFLVLPLTCFT